MTRKSDSESGGSCGTSSPTSSGLLERVKTRDRGAWQRFADVYAPLVYRWCRRTGVRADQAPDIIQEVFLAVALHIGGFRCDRPGDSFRGWLWTITRNKIHDHFRRQKNRPNARGGSSDYERLCRIPDQLPPAADAHSQAADHAALAQRLVNLIRPEVEDRTWRAFWRLAVDGQPGPDVAAELGMTLQAVHQAKYRVLRRVRDELNDVTL